MKATKKPVEVEAMRFGSDTATSMKVGIWMDVTNWMVENRYPWLEGDATNPDSLRYPDQAPEDDSRPDKGIYIDPATGGLMIRTLEGDMRVEVGDWIIRGVKGEFYACKNDIFRQTYDIEPEIGPSSIKVGGVNITEMTQCGGCGRFRAKETLCPYGCDEKMYRQMDEQVRGNLVKNSDLDNTPTTTFLGSNEIHFTEADVETVTFHSPSVEVTTDDQGRVVARPLRKKELSVDEYGHKIAYIRVDDLQRLFEAAQMTWKIQGADENHGPMNRVRQILEGEK